MSVDLLELYRQLVLIRRFEERTIELRLEGLVHGVVHPYLGQEAVAVGVCSVLRPEDRIVSTHRGHGHCIAKGADVERMMAELFGRRDGYCRGKGGSMHIAAFDIGMLGANGIVGAGLPIAAGAALASRMQGNDTVAVGFFSDGATGEGTFHEALNLAALWKLPVVWVCENNGYASDTPLRESVPTGAVAAFAAGYGIQGRQIDGNDVLAVRDAAEEAVGRARAGAGPTLLECLTLRGPTHALRDALPGDPRLADDVEGWVGGDPIERLERVVLERAITDEGGLAAVREAVERELAAAIERALASPFPEPEEALEDLFAGR